MIQESWQAEWIWTARTALDNNVYVEARKTFAIDSAFSQAKLRVSANQFYKLYVNGIEIGRGPTPADLSWISYDTYDVSDYLRVGSNSIAVLAYNFGQDMIVTGQLQGPGGIICQIDCYETNAAEDNVIRTIASSSDWKCRRSPRWKPQVSRLHYWGGYREIMDLSQEDGWEQSDYEDDSWPFAVAVAEAEKSDSPWPRLMPREIPFLRETLVSPISVVSSEPFTGEIRSPEAPLSKKQLGLEEFITIDASVPGSIPQITYDFGAEMVGYPELEVFSEEGGVLQLYFGESLEVALMDTYLLRKGNNRLSPFGRRAFRYMKVAVMATPVPLEVRSLHVRFVHYPYVDGGSFRCSDERLNRIWDTGRYTTIVNSQNHFEDCPYREGALWVADSVVMAKVVYQTFDDPALVRKSLLQSARIQNDDGSIPGTGPQHNSFLLPDFCAHWLFGVWEYYTYTKDTAFLHEVWPYVNRLVDWFADQEDASGLFANADREGWWCFIDWSDDIERKDRVTAISSFYYKFLNTSALMAEELGEFKAAAGFREKAINLRSTIRNLLRVPGTTVYADCLTSEGLSTSVTAQTNFAAAWSGIMDEIEVRDFVQNYYLKDRLPRIRGAFFYHIVLETLFRFGFAEAAIAQVRDYWGSMLDRGATTWWETFDPSLPFVTTPSPYLGHTPTYLQDSIPVSLCHGWGASPTYLLSEQLLGVDVSELGSGIVRLQPTAVKGIEWAEGNIPTQLGDIQAEWRIGEDGVIKYEVSLPKEISWTARGVEELTVAMDDARARVTGIITVMEQVVGMI
ncbi:alpha-L-rhamnosidase N-terminal domain-containing protein [Paenibacillus sp. LHD-38]|uniref:alpha-L-rhamnosidase-related protein n=1 Tax=Paenibacillus sp. LHD-38 TaxID=3072143 RepID=UPI002810263F|nr:family 78 glycoside hydrolase catalytic domain [Paenibacillus sp. LHD-38]MDQ8734760.1 alpha-L-rhamnosidase N-terminal domain-containing protein [Paenibacillus sp. LHD-38]